MVHVADLTDCRPTTLLDKPHLSRRKLDRGISSLVGHQLGSRSSTTHELDALANFELNIMNHRPEGDMTQRQGVPRFDVRPFTRHHHISHAQPNRSEDIAFLTGNIMQQSDAVGTIRVIFNCGNLRRHSVLLPTKIDDTIPSFVSPATLKTRHPAAVVPAATLVQGSYQRAGRGGFANLSKVRHTLETPSS